MNELAIPKALLLSMPTAVLLLATSMKHNTVLLVAVLVG